MDPAQLCSQLGGIARTAELLQLGSSRKGLARAVREGRVLRIREGVYAHPGTSLQLRHAVRHGGRLACASALRERGLWTIDDGGLHVHFGAEGHQYGHADCTQKVVAHWSGRTGRRWVLGVPESLAQLSRCGNAEDFLVALESALSTSPRMLAPSQLQDLRRRIAPDARPALDFARHDAGSGIESLARWRLHLLGIECATQVVIVGVGRVDLVIGDRLILELDGERHHAGAEAFERDRRRDAIAAAQGFQTLRYSYRQVMYDWPTVEAAVLAAVRQGFHESAAGRRYRGTQGRVRGL
jgi:very-short-patch-repair endonuclease